MKVNYDCRDLNLLMIFFCFEVVSNLSKEKSIIIIQWKLIVVIVFI
jgi:hypothetical protein